MAAGPPTRLIHSYGRRRGRRLRQSRVKLLGERLPQLAIDVPREAVTIDPAALFVRAPQAIWLEIGFGAGEHLAAQAAAHPDIGFIGCEPYVNGVAALLAALDAAPPGSRRDNVRLWMGDARELLPYLPAASIARVFVLYPDPWPKERHHKRRLISRAFLDMLARVMAPGADLRLATDDPGYLAWMLECLAGHADFAWLAHRPEVRRTRPVDWPATRYEQKAVAAGRPPAYLSLRRRSGPAGDGP
jgi:tRNA (guanine-N7-)-methyltransferase